MNKFCNPADKLIHIANNPKCTISNNFRFTDLVEKNLEMQNNEGSERDVMELPSVIGVNASLMNSSSLVSSNRSQSAL